MAEQCGASPPTLALARTDVDDSNKDLTHGAAKTPQQASFGGDTRDTAQRSDCGKLLPARGLPPDHLTHSHAAAEDATVDDAENSSPPEPPDASSPPQPTPDAADAEEFHAVAAKAAQMAAAATSQQPSIALSVWPGIPVSGSMM